MGLLMLNQSAEGIWISGQLSCGFHMKRGGDVLIKWKLVTILW